MRALAILLISLSAFPACAQSPCRGKIATTDERPYGANEIVGLRTKTVRRIVGKVTDANSAAIPNAVVEVYRCCGHMQPIPKERLRAYVADEEGRFCIRDLPSGRYLLMVGTHGDDGFKLVVMEVSLDRHRPSRWLRSGKELSIALQVGT
ncbi:MAG TPA: carboxypeptidase-like regulatory domain-containing protein [Blastocatellia bacterium]|nr:carboxypeptidase-like regulatory domain-containing protein [Blastocatellia bacterium]